MEKFVSVTFLLAGLLSAAGCGPRDAGASELETGLPSAPLSSDGPARNVPVVKHLTGDPAAGKAVFRFETFGNEGFWSEAARLPDGLEAVQLTALGALRLGLSIDLEALDLPARSALTAELNKSFLSGPLLNSHANFVKLLNSNAVIGLVVKDSNRDGRVDLQTGDKLGVSCALCHAITDSALLDNPTGGSIGRRVDGPAVHTIRMGALLALAANTRAFFPMAQLRQPDGKSIGRAPAFFGITKSSTEAEVDAYFSNPAFFPHGVFDDTADGVGNPLHNGPAFRTDLSGPWGSSGELAALDQFTNAKYTVALDPTTLLTPEGRSFLHKTAGAAGDRLAEDYAEVLKATGVAEYPYVVARKLGQPGDPNTPAGLRVAEQQLIDLNGYLDSLQAPSGAVVDSGAADRGRELFRTSAGCTACHNVNQKTPVPAIVIAMKGIFPADAPRVLGQREAPMGPLLDTEGSTFDDEMIVFNASLRGLARGVAMPLLMDLTRKPAFLHDDSVGSLDRLLDPERGYDAPHPFYVADPVERTEVVRFLQRLDDTRK
jgi:mono/diheme cytochrome c family protein